MNVESIGDREFIHSIHQSDGAWALFSGRAVYLVESEGGRALPIWGSVKTAEVFASKLEREGRIPVFVSLSSLLSKRWLESPELNIVEVLASPVFGQPALTYTEREFSEKFKT